MEKLTASSLSGTAIRRPETRENESSSPMDADTVECGSEGTCENACQNSMLKKAAALMNKVTGRISLPSSRSLQAAFLIALKDGGVSKGNSPHSPCVKAFREVFEKGDAKPGDIILVGGNAKPELSLLDSLVPGDYSHVGIYLGKDGHGDHKTIDAWSPEAQVRDINWWPQSYSRWSIIRPVKADGSELSDKERDKVLKFVESARGCAYNFKWINKDVVLPVNPEKTSFYCSQLAWASYYHGAGIDIDANPGVTLQYAGGVAPQELRDSKNIRVVSEQDFTSPVNSEETLYRLGGGIAGLALASGLCTLAMGSAPVSAAVICGVAVTEALGGALGVWGGKILHYLKHRHDG